MKMSIFSATAIVPTLARILLCAAFLSMGWNKLMNTHEFTGSAAATLIELGVVQSAPNATVTPASLRQDAPTTQQAPEQPPAQEPSIELPELPDMPEVPEPPADVLHEDPHTGERTVEAKRMHTVTIAVANAGWGQPVMLAWVATLTELIGGALLLIGLFSRVWALGLVVAMGTAFYLTSLPALMDAGLFSMAADLEGRYAAYNRMFTQLGLGVLALGVFLTGPGPLSLDRLLFRPSRTRDPELDDLP